MNLSLWKSAHTVLLAKKLVAGVLSVALLVTLFVSLGGSPTPAAAADETAAANTVSGHVFQNYTSNGWRLEGDSKTPMSSPVAGVTVTAYDAQGAAVGSPAMSAADGSYVLDVASAASKDLRVEFSGWDESRFEPAFAAQGDAPGGASGNNTTVQFVSLDGSGSASNIDFGLIVPEHYAQNNAPVVTPGQHPGLRGNAFTKNLGTVFAQPWQLDGATTAIPKGAISHLAKYQQVGSVWGSAYSRPANDLYISALMKRHSDLGPLGLGGIYKSSKVLVDGAISKTQPTPWLNVAGLTVSNAGDARLDIGNEHVKGRKLSGPGNVQPEIEAFEYSGRIGLGGIATSLDGTRLFVSNVYDGNVYGIDISDPSGMAPTSAYRITTPVTEAQSIWAVEVYEGRLYIGYVDTGDNGQNPVPGVAAATNGLNAYVASTPIQMASDATAVSVDWTREVTIDLGYHKGSNLQHWTAPDKKTPLVDLHPQMSRWNSWTDTWSWAKSGSTAAGTVGLLGQSQAHHVHQYPQAMLSSIAFDSDGYMNVGLQDRTMLQSGNRNFGAYPIKPGDVHHNGTKRLWNSIPSGDTLVAAPAAIPSELGNFTLETMGQVGDRPVRDSDVQVFVRDHKNQSGTLGTQKPTFENNQGPAGGEFFNDRRNLGTEHFQEAENHNEITLGSVSTYPGMREVAATALDPLGAAYISGLMWFDQRDGTASRGIELTLPYEEKIIIDKDTDVSKAFLKAGALGDIALLAEEAPVEIGNRVWLDADLNGRQDADEPAINGAVVSLHTVNEQGEPGQLIGTTKTATINGEPGTYYFRSDDNSGGANLEPGGNYVLVFGQGRGAVDLQGPNAGHAGFAGLTWGDLERTTQSAPGTSMSNDSNPNVLNGHALVAPITGPGDNDHTYDAGWYGKNTFELLKEFDPSAPAGVTSYDFNVVSATNFRGEERLLAGGSDPQVTETALTLHRPEWKYSSPAALPLGYTLVLEEQGAPVDGVRWSDPVAGDESQGQVVITPKKGNAARASVTATNVFGEFEIEKALRGTGKSRVPAETKFQIEYKLNGGDVVTAWVSQATPFRKGDLPIGTKVQVRETNPIVTVPANIAHVNWKAPSWSSGGTDLEADADGWYNFTLSEATPKHTLLVENTADEVFYDLSIVKQRAPGELLPDAKFTFQYKVGEAGAVIDLGPIAAGETAKTAKTLVAGTTIFVREIAPRNETGLLWQAPKWTNLPADAVKHADGWYSFVFTPQPNAPLALTAVNKLDPQYSSFSVLKTVKENGDGVIPIDDLTYNFVYRIAPVPKFGEAPVFGPEQTFTLNQDETWADAGQILVGSVIELREIRPTDSPGMVWGAPKWTGNQEFKTVGEWTRFTLTTENVNAEFTVLNELTRPPGGFVLQKALVGDGKDQVTDITFPVEVQVGDGPVQLAELRGDGTVLAWPEKPAVGTQVKVREVTPLPVIDGIKWGVPEWTGDADTVTTEADGWTVFTISRHDQAAVLTLTNKPSVEYGQFQLKKSLDTNDDPLFPRTYALEYKIGDAAAQKIELAPDQVSDLFAGVQLGTTVSVREIAPGSTPGLDWKAEKWKVNGAAATPDAQGWVKFEIDSTTQTVTFEVTNRPTILKGGFQVSKTVAGPGADLVDPNTPFVFSYTLDGGGVETVTATPAKASEIIGGLRVGTKVSIEEAAYPEILQVGFTRNPKWTLNGDSVELPVQFEIRNTNIVDLSVENWATPREGSFELTKRITGPAADRVGENEPFTVEYRVNGKGSWVSMGTITKASPHFESPDFLLGTRIELRETPPAAGESYDWSTPRFIVDGSAPSTTANFVITKEGQAIDVVLENPTLSRDGTFKVLKTVAGDFELTDQALSKLTFVVNWSGNDRSGILELNQSNGWSAGPETVFPRGTKITLTEAVVTGLPEHVKFTGYEWLEGMDGVIVSGDKQTATLTVKSMDPEALELKNTFESHGTFAVRKVVAGAFALRSNEMADSVFEVNYSTDTGETGTLELNAANDWTAAGQEYAAGTKITLTERTPAKFSADAGWKKQEWLDSPGVEISPDGKTAVLTVQKDAPIAELTLVNTAFREGSFSVAKVVDGNMTLDDPELSGLTFSVPYTATDGQSGTLSLNAGGNWVDAAGVDFIEGTVVTLTEADVAGLPLHVTWAGYTWVAGEGYEVSPDGKTASFTVTEDEVNPHLTLKNTFTKIGGFNLEKRVTGDKAELVPNDLEFIAEYSIDGGLTWVAMPAMTKDAPWVAGPTDIALGTTVLIREVTPAAVPDVTWRDPAFSGPGVTPGGPKGVASFVVNSSETPLEVVLQNPTAGRDGQFQMTKVITGCSASVVKGDPEFTVHYTYEGQQDPGEFKFKAGETVSSGLIPENTVVTITEVIPKGDLPEGMSWGTPVLVLADGTVLQNGATITIKENTVIDIQLENPTVCLENTGATGAGAGMLLGLLLGLAGFAMVFLGLRRRRSTVRV